VETLELNQSDSDAIDAMLAVRPIWRGQSLASDAVSLPANTLLHAGPEFSSPSDICKPILNSACVAAVFEGLTIDFDTAAEQIASGEIILKPAQDFNVVTPLAAVVSSRMWLHEVVDENNSATVAYTPINGGNGPAMRLGICSDDVLQFIRWLNSEFADTLSGVRDLPNDLMAIAAAALNDGDDCHGRTLAATGQLVAHIENEIGISPEALDFLRQCPSFFLNLWMAACKCMLNAASGIDGSSLITSMGANGVQTGIQIAGIPGQWFTALADVPNGDIGDYPASRALGAIGDSAIVDACGFGAMAMNYSAPQKLGLGPFMPNDGFERPAQLLSAVHPGFAALELRTGLTARRVIDINKTPLVSLGILDREGCAGRLGGGIFTTPSQPFRDAVNGLG
jgi:hypothetical protein